MKTINLIVIIIFLGICFFSCNQKQTVDNIALQKKDSSLQIVLNSLQFDEMLILYEKDYGHVFEQLNQPKIKFGTQEYFIAKQDEEIVLENRNFGTTPMDSTDSLIQDYFLKLTLKKEIDPINGKELEIRKIRNNIECE